MLTVKQTLCKRIGGLERDSVCPLWLDFLPGHATNPLPSATQSIPVSKSASSRHSGSRIDHHPAHSNCHRHHTHLLLISLSPSC